MPSGSVKSHSYHWESQPFSVSDWRQKYTVEGVVAVEGIGFVGTALDLFREAFSAAEGLICVALGILLVRDAAVLVRFEMRMLKGV